LAALGTHEQRFAGPDLVQSQLVDGDGGLAATRRVSEEDDIALGIRADQQTCAAIGEEQHDRRRAVKPEKLPPA